MTLRARDVRVAFNGRTVLDGIDLDVASGEWVGIIGPNGAGKTTLLKALAGLVPADGSVRVDGEDISHLSGRRRAASIALVPQRPIIPAGITVLDYVLLGRTPYAGPLVGFSRTDLDAVERTLRRLDLLAFADRDLTTLSGGELRRTVIARALAQQTPVLLLDEPTAALDVGRQQEVMELVDQLRRERNVAVVGALHDLTLAGQFADRLVLLAGGRVVDEGRADAVLTPAAIRRHYGARVRIVDDGSGGIVVIPVRLPASTDADTAVG